MGNGHSQIYLRNRPASGKCFPPSEMSTNGCVSVSPKLPFCGEYVWASPARTMLECFAEPFRTVSVGDTSPTSKSVGIIATSTVTEVNELIGDVHYVHDHSPSLGDDRIHHVRGSHRPTIRGHYNLYIVLGNIQLDQPDPQHHRVAVLRLRTSVHRRTYQEYSLQFIPSLDRATATSLCPYASAPLKQDSATSSPTMVVLRLCGTYPHI